MPEPRQQPAEYGITERSFPDGSFSDETPPEVYLAAALAIRLKNRIGNDSIRYVAKKADLSPQTILNILNGKTWPDLRTIARLETALSARLWGYEHRKYPSAYI